MAGAWAPSQAVESDDFSRAAGQTTRNDLVHSCVLEVVGFKLWKPADDSQQGNCGAMRNSLKVGDSRECLAAYSTKTATHGS